MLNEKLLFVSHYFPLRKKRHKAFRSNTFFYPLFYWKSFLENITIYKLFFGRGEFQDRVSL